MDGDPEEAPGSPHDELIDLAMSTGGSRLIDAYEGAQAVRAAIAEFVLTPPDERGLTWSGLAKWLVTEHPGLNLGSNPGTTIQNYAERHLKPALWAKAEWQSRQVIEAGHELDFLKKTMDIHRAMMEIVADTDENARGKSAAGRTAIAALREAREVAEHYKLVPTKPTAVQTHVVGHVDLDGLMAHVGGVKPKKVIDIDQSRSE